MLKPKKRKRETKMRHVHFKKDCPFEAARAVRDVLRACYNDHQRERVIRMALEDLGWISGIKFDKGPK